MKISLADALKMQKDLMKKLKIAQALIISNNSFIGLPKEDVNALRKEQEKNRGLMIELKLAIREATSKEIAAKIFKLSELKEELKCLNKISTKEGTFTNGKTTVEYNVFLNKSLVTAELKKVREEIQNIENTLKEYNENTLVDVKEFITLGEVIQPKT